MVQAVFNEERVHGIYNRGNGNAGNGVVINCNENQPCTGNSAGEELLKSWQSFFP